MPEEENTRDKIFNAAVDLFTRKGFYETSVREIASASGIRVSSLYNHFKSKESILESILEYYRAQTGNVRISDERLDEITGNENPVEILVKSFHSLTESFSPVKMSKILHIIVIEKYRNPLVRKFYIDYSAEGKNTIMKLFKKMIKAGLLKDHDAGLLRDMYVSFVNNFYYDLYLLKAENRDTSGFEKNFEKLLYLFFELLSIKKEM